MNKKQIIITAAAGLVTFAGFFVFSWLTASAPAQGEIDSSNEQALLARQDELQLPLAESGSAVRATGSKAADTMTERQLKDLVADVREKMQEYDRRLQGLELRKQRLKTAHNMIKDDLEELNNLRIELASTVTAIKDEQAKLKARLIEVDKVEKDNLVTIAATYDKMDAATAGKILIDMVKMESSSGATGFEDAVKILHYMGERSRGKLLVELASSESRLAATFCRKLKRIVEKE